MTTTNTHSSLDRAAARLLDALIDGGDATVELSLPGVAQLLAALHDEARRRGWGVVIEPIKGEPPCLSLRRR
jgi:hypothetical protein